jgi:hypothetical protein
MHDFNINGYSASAIINEYNSALSLRLEVADNERKNRDQYKQRGILHDAISSLQFQVNTHRQTINAVSELASMGLGLKELKQLWRTIIEICDANSIPSDQGLSKFLKDVEEQYDMKLGFESKLNEKKDELAQLKREISNKHLILRWNPSVTNTLYNLIENEVGESGIIAINQLVQDLKFSGSCFDPYPNDNHDHNKCDAPNKNPEIWKSLMDGLKRYGGLKLAIKKESENLHRVKLETQGLNKQKQGIWAYCQLASFLTNAMDSKISYFRGLADYCYRSLGRIERLINITCSPSIHTNIVSLPIILVFMAHNKFESNGPDRSENEVKDKEKGQQAKEK